MLPKLGHAARGAIEGSLDVVAFAYLTLGAAGAVVGGLALVAGTRRALPRTRHNVHEAIDVLRDKL